jgi:phage host-nuclease inhibitor protein Gam
MPSRLKAITSIDTRAQFDATVDEICRLQLDREAIVTFRDSRLATIMEEENPKIERISEDISAKLLLCEKYAVTHRETLFGKLKSAASALATFGFRTGNPTLKVLNRKWKWNDVVAALKSSGRFDCVRTKEEPDKDALKKLPGADLASVGLRIDQEESFYIEPKREEPDRITTG